MRKFFAAVCAGLLCIQVQAENWPQFRGPRGDGTSTEKNVPTRWSATDNVAWKTPIPGGGHGSPVVWGHSVFVTSAIRETGERALFRIDARTGEVLWKKVVLTTPRESMHRENSSASSTPATDGKFVFTSFQNGDRVDLRCYDFEGNEIWAIQPLAFEGQHGYSYSPIVFEDLLLLDCRQEGEAAILGLDKRTGKERWRAKPGNNRISHITPLIIHDGTKHQMIVSGSDETASYDPRTGKRLWWCKGPSEVSVAGMVYADGLLFVTSGYPSRSRMAIRVDGSGDVTESHVVWNLRRQATYVPSPVYHQGHVYSVLDEGMMLCINLESGEPVWQERLGGRYRSSLLLAEGKVYATNDEGITTILEATPEGLRAIGKNELEEFCYTTPAISNGRIFIRTAENLYCIGGRNQNASL